MASLTIHRSHPVRHLLVYSYDLHDSMGILWGRCRQYRSTHCLLYKHNLRYNHLDQLNNPVKTNTSLSNHLSRKMPILSTSEIWIWPESNRWLLYYKHSALEYWGAEADFHVGLVRKLILLDLLLKGLLVTVASDWMVAVQITMVWALITQSWAKESKCSSWFALFVKYLLTFSLTCFFMLMVFIFLKFSLSDR